MSNGEDMYEAAGLLGYLYQTSTSEYDNHILVFRKKKINKMCIGLCSEGKSPATNAIQARLHSYNASKLSKLNIELQNDWCSTSTRLNSFIGKTSAPLLTGRCSTLAIRFQQTGEKEKHKNAQWSNSEAWIFVHEKNWIRTARSNEFLYSKVFSCGQNILIMQNLSLNSSKYAEIRW